MDLIEQAEQEMETLRAIVRSDMAKAEQEYQDSKKPNYERLRAMGMMD